MVMVDGRLVARSKVGMTTIFDVPEEVLVTMAHTFLSLPSIRALAETCHTMQRMLLTHPGDLGLLRSRFGVLWNVTRGFWNGARIALKQTTTRPFHLATQALATTARVLNAQTEPVPDLAVGVFESLLRDAMEANVVDDQRNLWMSFALTPVLFGSAVAIRVGRNAPQAFVEAAFRAALSVADPACLTLFFDRMDALGYPLSKKTVGDGLCSVASRGPAGLVRLLLARAKTATPAVGGQSPLRLACEAGLADVVAVLLADKRCTPSVYRNKPLAMTLEPDDGGAACASLLLASPRFKPHPNDAKLLVQAVKEDKEGVALAMVQDGRTDPSVEANYIIKAASTRGFTDLVRALLADPRVDPSAGNNTACRKAARHGFPELLRLLLADPRVDPTDVDNEALVLAASYNKVAVVRLLLEDGRIDVGADVGVTTLAQAAGSAFVGVVEALLEDPRVEPSGHDNLALMSAVEIHNIRLVEALLADPRVDPGPSSLDLFQAVVKRNPRRAHKDTILALLLQHPSLGLGAMSAKLVEAVLTSSWQNGRGTLTDVLVEAVSSSPGSFAGCVFENEAFLVHAGRWAPVDTISRLLGRDDVDPAADEQAMLLAAVQRKRDGPAVVRLLLEHPRVDPAAQANAAISIAAGIKRVDGLRVASLLASDPRVDMTSLGEEKCCRLFVRACKAGHVELVVRILEDGMVDPNHGDGQGLIGALERERWAVVAALLEDPRIDAGVRDQTPLRVAVLGSVVPSSRYAWSTDTRPDGAVSVVCAMLANPRVNPALCFVEGSEGGPRIPILNAARDARMIVELLKSPLVDPCADDNALLRSSISTFVFSNKIADPVFRHPRFEMGVEAARTLLTFAVASGTMSSRVVVSRLLELECLDMVDVWRECFGWAISRGVEPVFRQVMESGVIEGMTWEEWKGAVERCVGAGRTPDRSAMLKALILCEGADSQAVHVYAVEVAVAMGRKDLVSFLFQLDVGWNLSQALSKETLFRVAAIGCDDPFEAQVSVDDDWLLAAFARSNGFPLSVKVRVLQLWRGPIPPEAQELMRVWVLAECKAQTNRTHHKKSSYSWKRSAKAAAISAKTKERADAITLVVEHLVSDPNTEFSSTLVAAIVTWAARLDAAGLMAKLLKEPRFEGGPFSSSLVSAAARNHVRVMKVLLADEKVHPFRDGFPSLCLARRHSQVDAIKLLTSYERTSERAKRVRE